MNHIKKVRFLGLLCIAGAWLLVPASCGIFSRFFPGEFPLESAGSEARRRSREAELPAPFLLEGAAKKREALLLRGNTVRTGIPGFGENAFPAVYGEYSLSIPGAAVFGMDGETPGFTVWISRESLYFPNPPWIPRSGVPGCRLMERNLAGSIILGVTGEEPGAGTADTGAGAVSATVPGAIGTLVFQIPLAAADALGPDGLNRLIGMWVFRFACFFNLPGGSGAFSLPAVLNF
ncbi:MAG: hypothetical protein LBD78_02850 [Spirochaetaceae bacterium]|jgi:hypothetical protein|nr:hypothetical protein [Spirochaetaceae bacterium]